MTEEVEIRPLRREEMAEAARVHRISFDRRLPWLAGRHTPAEDTWFFQERVFPENHMHGAIVGGRIVGIIAFTSEWINQLYVLPESQGRRLGSRLLAIAQAEAASLRLWTFQRNIEARRFYERHGFFAVEMTDGSGNEEKEADVLYEWSKPP